MTSASWGSEASILWLEDIAWMRLLVRVISLADCSLLSLFDSLLTCFTLRIRSTSFGVGGLLVTGSLINLWSAGLPLLVIIYVMLKPFWLATAKWKVPFGFKF